MFQLRFAALGLGMALLVTACDDDDAYQPDQPNADAGDAGKRGDAATAPLDSGALGGLDSGLGLDAQLAPQDAATRD
jgi:hypothetical protein